MTTNFQFLKISCPFGTSLLQRICISEVILLGYCATSFEDFSDRLMQQYGITVKESRGRLSYLPAGRTKFIRAKHLGDQFEKELVLAALKANTERKRTIQSKSDRIGKLVDTQAKLKQGKGIGYERWAKKHNLKAMSQTLILLQEKGLLDEDALDQRITELDTKFHESLAVAKDLETRMTENKNLRSHATAYQQYRPIAQKLKAAKSPATFEEHVLLELKQLEGPSKLRQQFSRGMTFFLVVAASLLFYFALLRMTDISGVLNKVFNVLKPVVYGCVIAYLLNPLVKKIDTYLRPQLEKHMKKPEQALKLTRGIGILASLILMTVLIVTLFNLLIPELYSSIRNMIFTLPGQLNDLIQSLNGIEIDDSTTGKLIKTALEEGTNMLQEWLRTDLLARTNALMTNLTEGVINLLNEIFNALIGVIVSVYILFSKETFSSQCKKCIYAMFSPRHANFVLHLTTKSNEIFGGFIIGKLIDSAIIGVLCFFGLSILDMPYVMLVSVIVGVTNVIPFFGPYIGAIPSTVLIMLSDPLKGIYFVIFILLLQQFDGNILGPKILGNSTGLSAFWVIVAILLGGGLFGFAGMIMGVPTFAVLYYIVEMLMNNRLEKKKLPVDSQNYDALSYVQHIAVAVELQETLRILRFRGGTLGETVGIQPGYHADLARLLVTDYQHVLFVFFLCHLKNVLMGYL